MKKVSLKWNIFMSVFYATMPNKTCPFCMRDELFVRETKHCAIFVNLNQVARADAVLVVPTRHVKHIGDLSTEEYYDFCDTIKDVRQRMVDAGRDKFNFLINEGLVANQNVPHLHAHIFSRVEKDGIKNMTRKNRKNIFTERTPESTEVFLQRIKSYLS